MYVCMYVFMYACMYASSLWNERRDLDGANVD